MFKGTTSILLAAALSAQVARAATCTFTSPAIAGDTCASFSAIWSLSLSQFVAGNPSVGQGCSNGLQPGSEYCVEWGFGPQPNPTTPAPPTTPVPTAPGGPSPTQTGTPARCHNWHMVVSGDFCQKIADQYSIPLSQFYQWNPAVGSGCESLWLGYYVCVGLSSAGGWTDSYPGMEGISSVTGLDIVPDNAANPLRVSGRVLGVGQYPEATWTNWLNTVECESPNNPRRFDQACATEAFVQAASNAIQTVANNPSITNGVNAAGLSVIGPRFQRLNQKNAYIGDHGQGKSCPTCPALVDPRQSTAWKGTFLPESTVFYLKSVRIKVTCKKSCGAGDVNVENLNNVLRLIPGRIRDARGGGANFFIWRDTTKEVVTRCRATYAQGVWFDRVDGGADQVYGGEEATSCFRQ